MAKKVNKPGMIPIIPDSVPPTISKAGKSIDKVIKRPDFITKDPKSPTPSATFKTYFASGQSPNGMTDTMRGYQIPADWPKANSLLKMPQQVWLTINAFIGEAGTDEQFQHNFLEYICYHFQATAVQWFGVQGSTDETITYYYSDGSVYTYNSTGNYSVFPPTLTETRSGSAPPDIVVINTPTPKPVNEESERIPDMFVEVQKIIRQLRPNRTWVDVICLTRPEMTPNNVLPETSRDESLDMNGRNTYMIAPEPTEKFLGTNFLHIFVAGSNNITLELTDDQYVKSRAQVVACFSRFVNYSVQMYSMNFDDIRPAEPSGLYILAPMINAPSCPTISYPTVPPGAPTSVFFYPFTEEEHLQDLTYFGGAETYNYAAVISNESIEENFALNQTQPTMKDYFPLVADDMKDYGFIYGGDSHQLQVDYLVRLIAKYFKFDPSSGKDLPLGPPFANLS